ncbi:MAG TPA: GNAT family N-acetyltransferase [Chloroflexota bacterium]|nr:GNAT family N-acetyltransferase [Chloroflexota bacterium]
MAGVARPRVCLPGARPDLGPEDQMIDCPVAIVDRADRLDPTRWDDLAGDRPFADHRWLRLAEAVLVGHEPRYVVVERGGQYAAAAVCALGRRLQNPALQRRVGWLLHMAPHLRCEIPIAFQPGLFLRPGEHADALLAEIGRLAARERALFVRIDHLRPDAGGWDALSSAGYKPFPMWDEATLDLGCGSLDAYLARLPSRKRGELNAVRRRADAAGLVVAPHTPSAASAPLLRRLVGQVLGRHAALEQYRGDLFARAAGVLGGDLLVLTAERDGRIVATASLLRSGDDVAAKWLGLDYALTWNTPTYPRLMLACVEHAIAMGARRLHLGATAHETKRHFGVVFEPRAGAISARLPLLTRLAGRALAGGVGATAATA